MKLRWRRRAFHDVPVDGVVSLVVQIIPQQLLPTFKDGHIDEGTKLFPETALAARLFTTGPEGDIAKFRDLMERKGQQSQPIKIEGDP